MSFDPNNMAILRLPSVTIVLDGDNNILNRKSENLLTIS